MKMKNCMGCFRQDVAEFCGKCRKALFDGKKVSSVLNFTRPEYTLARQKLADRMSISGVQTKISLILDGKELRIAEAGGHYILKPIPQGEFANLELVPINEHLTMRIASQVFGIETAANALVTFPDGSPCYLTRRFDVLPTGTRALQEDFAQIAGISEETNGKNYKYDFSYEKIGRLIKRHVAAAAVDLERFFTLVVFNYFIHNGDAHVKNFSMNWMEDTGEYRLSPAYDLLNTRLHVPNESRTALEMFEGDFQTVSFQANGFYAYDDFVELAKRFGIKEVRYQRILKGFGEKLTDTLNMIERSALPMEAQEKYKLQVEDGSKAIGYSYSMMGG